MDVWGEGNADDPNYFYVEDLYPEEPYAQPDNLALAQQLVQRAAKATVTAAAARVQAQLNPGL
jgi:hypothetical protein